MYIYTLKKISTQNYLAMQARNNYFCQFGDKKREFQLPPGREAQSKGTQVPIHLWKDTLFRLCPQLPSRWAGVSIICLPLTYMRLINNIN